MALPHLALQLLCNLLDPPQRLLGLQLLQAKQGQAQLILLAGKDGRVRPGAGGQCCTSPHAPMRRREGPRGLRDSTLEFGNTRGMQSLLSRQTTQTGRRWRPDSGAQAGAQASRGSACCSPQLSRPSSLGLTHLLVYRGVCSP